jgi:hypothetical protein
MIPPREHLISIEDRIIGARSLWRLPSCLRHPVGPEGAGPILRQRLERREADFLALAGCEYGDLERIVGQEGVKGALHTLCRQGVYLILGEFKVRRAVVRGGATIAADPSQFRNPLSASHMPVRNSGSRRCVCHGITPWTVIGLRPPPRASERDEGAGRRWSSVQRPPTRISSWNASPAAW